LSLLGLGARMHEVSETTSRLSAAVGRVEGARAQSKGVQAKQARLHCAAVFNNVHESLSLLLAQATSDPARQHLSALLAPFQSLLARHAAPPPSPPKADPDAPPAAS
jgi:hypothetical protein